MQFIDIPTEQTTAVTDFILFILSIWTVYKISKEGIGASKAKAKIWIWVFILLSIAAIFGAVAHGFQMGEIHQIHCPIYTGKQQCQHQTVPVPGWDI